jgi:N-acetylneuraminate synthase/sialic acid synthase
MGPTLRIGNAMVGDDSEAFVIAEVGHNHQGSIERCREIFRAAKESGCDAVKLQKRHNRSLYTRAMYERPYENEVSFGATYGEHREKLEFGRAEYEELIAYAAELGLEFIATAFDFESADFLAELDLAAIKIASGDLTNLPLQRHIAALGRPILLSTGIGELTDVRRAHDTIVEINPRLSLLQCTASYPCEFSELNLRVLSTYRQHFPQVVIGASLHDSGIAMAVVAYVLGARIIEKHFTLNRAWKGTDHAFSLEPVGMRKLVRDLRRTRLAMGDGVKRIFPSEAAAGVKMGKSLYAARALPAGTLLAREDLVIKSPGGFLPPYRLAELIGARLGRALAAEEPISWDALWDLRPDYEPTRAVARSSTS